MARKFFYICAGMCLLAVTFQLGARSVGAQGVGSYVVGSFDVDTDPLVIDAGGNMWMMGWSNSRGVHIGPVPLPRPGIVLAASVSVGGPDTYDARVLYDNGDAYVHNSTNWQYVGNVVGGPTPATHESWGQLKDRYRTTPLATPGTTATLGANGR
jgi:hypothetical protein